MLQMMQMLQVQYLGFVAFVTLASRATFVAFGKRVRGLYNRDTLCCIQYATCDASVAKRGSNCLINLIRYVSFN